MQVTETMETEAGGLLSRLADILDDDGQGLKVEVAEMGHLVKLTVDSAAYPNKTAYLDPDDADALADLLKMRAREARGIR